jgi:Icc-related predicted phosphoesterase
MRLFFCTDLHGSEICFRKLLSAPKVYGAEVLLMGGDCTGKMVVPVVHGTNGTYRCEWSGSTLELPDGEELADCERQIRNGGYYPVRFEADEFQDIAGDESRRDRLFTETMLETLRGWVSLAEERLLAGGVRMIVTPGNDDEFVVDEVLRGAAFITAAEGEVLTVDGYEMLSVGWSNPTPWETPRECTEEELGAKINALAGQISDMSRAIFNIHVPPYGTGLDEAPELDAEQRPVRGGAVMASVGSTAVRDAILEYQPLLSLHGHIHESRGMQKLGRTTCINPGSSYGDWVLQGVTVDLQGDRVKRYSLTCG